MFKRGLILTDNEKVVMRNDSNVNGYDNIEKDMFNFIIALDEKKNILNSKKLMNMLKIYHGITISDTIDIFTNNKNWRINNNHPTNYNKFDNVIIEE